MSPGACRHQQADSDPMELELQVVISHLTWVLEVGLRSSVGAVHPFNHHVISPALSEYIFKAPTKTALRRKIVTSRLSSVEIQNIGIPLRCFKKESVLQNKDHMRIFLRNRTRTHSLSIDLNIRSIKKKKVFSQRRKCYLMRIYIYKKLREISQIINT